MIWFTSRMDEKVIRWLVFGVLLSLVPLAWTAIILMNRGLLEEYGVLWKQGELLLLSVMLTAAAIGDLIESGGDAKKRRLGVGGIALILLLVSCGWYGDIGTAKITGADYKPAFVMSMSPWMFLFSLICSFSCLMVARQK